MISSRKYALFVATVVALGGFVFGFDASVISGANRFVIQEFGLNDLQLGFVVGASTLGAIVSSMIAGAAADRWGRKPILITIASLYVVSAIFSAIAPSYSVLVMARFLGGLAFCSLILAPMYIAEIAPAKLRGRMISINQLNIVVGFSAAYFANYLFLQAASGSENGWLASLGFQENVWRWMLGVEALPAFLFLVALCFVPESPRWLLLKGKDEQAETILTKINEPEEAVIVKGCIKAELDKEEGRNIGVVSGLRYLFSSKARLMLIIGIIVGLTQQVTGVNAIYFYAPTIFEQSGVGTDAAFTQAIWVGLVNVIFTVIAMGLIDRLGRRPLLMMGLVGVVLSMSICGYGFKQAYYEITPTAAIQLKSQEGIDAEKLVGQRYVSDVSFKQAIKATYGEADGKTFEAALIKSAAHMNSKLILIGILGFVASFAVSLGPVMWVLLAEIFPNHIRGIAISFIGVLNSGVSFSIQLIFPWELNHLGAATTFGIFGLFALIGFLFVAWLLPETKGKTLEQLQRDLTMGDGDEVIGAQSSSSLKSVPSVS